jgi:hypothetical protein
VEARFAALVVVLESEASSGLQGVGGEEGASGARASESERVLDVGAVVGGEGEERAQRETVGGRGESAAGERPERTERLADVGVEEALEASEEVVEREVPRGESEALVNEGESFVNDDGAREVCVVWLLEELERQVSEHVGEADVHVDLDASVGGVVLVVVGGAGPLGEGVVVEEGAAGAEELASAAERSEEVSKVELLAEGLLEAVVVEDVQASDALACGGVDAAEPEVFSLLLGESVSG